MHINQRELNITLGELKVTTSCTTKLPTNNSRQKKNEIRANKVKNRTSLQLCGKIPNFPRAQALVLDEKHQESQ